jgi:hypothetical protein
MPEIVEQYTQLLSALPEEAQWWITGMGWGLEDLVLDANEVALLELLAEKNVPTAMSILTSPDIIDGVTSGEVTWAQGYEVESLSALLQDDIDELLSQELLCAGHCTVSVLCGGRSSPRVVFPKGHATLPLNRVRHRSR